MVAVVVVGAVLPLGTSVPRPPPRTARKAASLHMRHYAMSENEYIVFDASQVCIRYIIQFKV